MTWATWVECRVPHCVLGTWGAQWLPSPTWVRAQVRTGFNAPQGTPTHSEASRLLEDGRSTRSGPGPPPSRGSPASVPAHFILLVSHLSCGADDREGISRGLGKTKATTQAKHSALHGASRCEQVRAGACERPPPPHRRTGDTNRGRRGLEDWPRAREEQGRASQTPRLHHPPRCSPPSRRRTALSPWTPRCRGPGFTGMT